MKYQELILHLYHLKILAHLDQNKIAATDYLENLRQDQKAQTKHDILEGNNDYHKLNIDELVDKSYNIALETHKKDTELEIEQLLNEAGFEKPLFGSLAITFDNLLNTFQKPDYKDFRNYIFGKPKFKKQTENPKTSSQLVTFYSKLLLIVRLISSYEFSRQHTERAYDENIFSLEVYPFFFCS